MRRHRPRHLKRPEPYQGWGPPSFLDEADQLAMAQAGDTPPMGIPVYRSVPAPTPPPRRGMDPAMRWVLAGFSALACLVLGAILILAVAFAMGPPPATAEPDQGVPVVVDHGKVRLKDGAYTLERRSP